MILEINHKSARCQIDWGSVLGGIGTGFATGGVLGAVAGGVAGVAGGGTAANGKGLVGGTVTRTGGGLIFVKLKSGREVAIKRKRTRRFHSSGRRSGIKLERLMELSMMKSMLK